jgi:hypothetical protein
MNRIGYWMTDLREPRLPLPQELVGTMETEVRERVCEYLSGGELFETYRGYSWCRFGCGIGYDRMGCREFTDGEWVWPEGLVHYVRCHGIVLPEEFVAKAMTGPVSSTMIQERDVTLEVWMNWAEARRPPAMRLRLEEALAAARVAYQDMAEKYRRERAAEYERKQGLGDKKCLWAGCEHRALKERVCCGSHCIPPQEVGAVAARAYRVDVPFLTRGLF